MNIAIIGQGNTGQHVEGVARERGHEIAEVFDIHHPLEETDDLRGVTCIDFSVAEMAVPHVRYCGEQGNNLVVGTTGWYDHLDEVKSLVEASEIGFLYAPNFALGVNLFFRAVDHVSRLFSTGNYDIAIHETHHTKKSDAPSGTALELGKIALQHFKEKTELLVGNPEGRIQSGQLQISSCRLGDVYGDHEVAIEGPFDSLRLRHSVKSRRIFAEGAVIAAEWLEGKQGFYTIHDLIDSLLQKG